VHGPFNQCQSVISRQNSKLTSTAALAEWRILAVVERIASNQELFRGAGHQVASTCAKAYLNIAFPSILPHLKGIRRYL
jgi:hypothetical protein